MHLVLVAISKDCIRIGTFLLLNRVIVSASFEFRRVYALLL